MNLYGEYRDSIEVCQACCGTGELWRFRERITDWYLDDHLSFTEPSAFMPENDIEKATCWACDGAKKWRKPGAPWTKLDEMPQQILEYIERKRWWFVLKANKGTLQFIAPVSLDLFSPEQLMDVLKTNSLLGDILESHGWIVEY